MESPAPSSNRRAANCPTFPSLNVLAALLLIVGIAGLFFPFIPGLEIIGIATDMSAKEKFLSDLGPVAEAMSNRYGINPKIALVHWGNETGWGTGTIYRATNNLGSITAEGSWAYFDTKSQTYLPRPGKMIYVTSAVEYVDHKEPITGKVSKVRTIVKRAFRKYSTLDAAAADWAQLLQSPRYDAARIFASQGDLKNYALELAKAGYGTSPSYAADLIAAGTGVLA